MIKKVHINSIFLFSLFVLIEYLQGTHIEFFYLIYILFFLLLITAIMNVLVIFKYLKTISDPMSFVSNIIFHFCIIFICTYYIFINELYPINKLFVVYGLISFLLFIIFNNILKKIIDEK